MKSIKQYNAVILAHIDQLRDTEKQWDLIDKEIPAWQEKTKKYIAERKKAIEDAIAEERARWGRALHVMQRSDETIESEIDESRRTLAKAPVTPYNMAILGKQQRDLRELEQLYEMKKGDVDE